MSFESSRILPTASPERFGQALSRNPFFEELADFQNGDRRVWQVALEIVEEGGPHIHDTYRRIAKEKA